MAMAILILLYAIGKRLKTLYLVEDIISPRYRAHRGVALLRCCSNVMFCRVCGIRVKVWESYRTCRSFGLRYGSVTKLTEVSGIAARAYRTHRSSGRVQIMLYPYPGYCETGRTELIEI